MPVYLNALSGKGVHVVTVNEYLSGIATEMGELYSWLGFVSRVNFGSPMEKLWVWYYLLNQLRNRIDYLRDSMVVRATT